MEVLNFSNPSLLIFIRFNISEKYMARLRRNRYLCKVCSAYAAPSIGALVSRIRRRGISFNT